MTLPVYTLDEAAEKLHKGRRWLQDWLRDHPSDQQGVPFFDNSGPVPTFRRIT